jgi:Tfp pilus assembly protein PilW
MRTIARIPCCKTKAFTLVEVLVAAMLTLVVVFSATAITLQFLKTYQYEEYRITTNHDIRRFTEQMTDDAAHANCFFIYPNFSSITAGMTSTSADPAITQGSEGDYLVLVTTGYNQVTGATTVTNVVGYYRVVPTGSTTNIGAVYRYSFDYSAAPIAWTSPFFTWLVGQGIVSTIQGVNNDIPSSATAASSTHKLFEASVIGDPASGLTGQLFYDFLVTGIMVKARIEDQSNPNLVKVIDTYNLTIAPHG